MADKYLIVNEKILPSFYEKVIEARNLINSGMVSNVSEAVKQVGISRSTYYKFKDYVFLPTENSVGKKAVIALMLMHRRGVLSEVLNIVNSQRASVLTINQSIPINGQASVMVSLDISDLEGPIDALVTMLQNTRGVSSAKLIAFD